MRLPNGDRAHVPRRKVTAYLLSPVHPVGRHKRRVFEALGFAGDRPGDLLQALRTVARAGTVVETVVSRYGTRYIVDGVVDAPGKAVTLRTVWMAGGDQVPRFVTAYPLRD